MTVWFANEYPDAAVNYYTSEDADTVDVQVLDSAIIFTDDNASSMSLVSDIPGANCTHTNSTTITCPTHATETDNGNDRRVLNVGVITWAGDDTITASGRGWTYGSTYRPIQLNIGSWEGDDTITSTGGLQMVTAGDGNDTIVSGPGPAAGAGPQFTDRLDGGAGDDTIDAYTNSGDVDGIYCRAGSDKVTVNSTDLLYDSANCESVTTH
ncbi:hypothetical protein [Microbispora sp. ATCC PTA-5024]|uniref:hypothetical protein n=1 Tax=Microbispora sp. ATCC PTA-5024 TaxID=316330 RepID=UPI0003DC8455|nr:hypothetical protein [Microbispora sp. ATCC PTA-5024]ETK32825.1 hypothetical protein MPTA5024_27755 [Microbispora sp. ATCC PTA-5024]